MRRGIVITTSEYTRPFYKDLIDSLYGCKYPVVTVFNPLINSPYESGGLRVGMVLFDEFIYIQDTVIIKDLSLFDKLFEHDGMISIAPNFLMYLGKYESQKLREVQIPQVWDKKGAIAMEFWLRTVFPVSCFDPTFIDGNHTWEEKHGRRRMVLENIYIKKFKSCWDVTMIESYENRG
jgi:hypothetical protein